MIYFCSMIRIILIGLGLYFLYRFVFHFLVPVSKAAGEMKSKIKEFQEQMNAKEFATQPQAPKTEQKTKKEDYIEFEDVK